MLYIWELLIESIFPLSTNEKIVRGLTPQILWDEYQPQCISQIYFFSSYKCPLISALITTAKFSNNKKALYLLSQLLTAWLETGSYPDANTLLIPIPLHPKREQARGYNQVTRVLKLVKMANYQISEKILYRIRPTISQTSLNKRDRTKNLVGAFSVNTKEISRVLNNGITKIIICDDVYTTGSTLLEAKHTLAKGLPKNCQLVCLAWAH